MVGLIRVTSDELVEHLPKAIRIFYLNKDGTAEDETDYALIIGSYFDWRETEKWRWTAGYEFYEHTLDDGADEDMRGYGDTMQECLSNLLDKVTKMVTTSHLVRLEKILGA
jgi:hypothetical protein